MTSCNDDELLERGELVAWELRGADRETVKALCARISQLTEQLKEAEAVRRVWVDWCPYSVIEARLCNGDIISDAAFNLNLTGKEKPTTVVALCLATSARSTLSKD